MGGDSADSSWTTALQHYTRTAGGGLVGDDGREGRGEGMGARGGGEREGGGGRGREGGSSQ